MKYLRKALMLISVLALLMTSGCYLIPDEEEVLAPPIKERRKVKYNTVKVGRGDIKKYVKCIAYVRASRQEELSFIHRSGYLTRVYKEYGDLVKVGDVLAELETDMIRISIKKQEIIYEDALSNYESILNSQGVQLESAENELRKMQKQYTVMLKIKDSYAETDFDNIEDKIETQKMRIRQLEQDKKDRIRGAKKNLDLAKIQLEELNTTLASAVIYAPFDGVVTYVTSLNAGEKVQVRETVITVADTSDKRLEYKGNKCIEFLKGQRIETILNEKTYMGEVVGTGADVPKDEYEKLKDRILFDLEEWPETIELNKPVKVVSLLSSSLDTLIVPKGAVTDYKGRRFVKALVGEVVIEKDVELGIHDDIYYEIISGLEEGEEIIR